MKIRIGNDLLFRVTLNNISSTDSINIKSLQAFIINSSLKDEHDLSLRKKLRFLGRFPIEPCCDAYIPTGYDIKTAGYPSYIAYPQTYCV